jgi:hypothetical protein
MMLSLWKVDSELVLGVPLLVLLGLRNNSRGQRTTETPSARANVLTSVQNQGHFLLRECGGTQLYIAHPRTEQGR